MARKSLKEEVQVVRYMAELAPKVFKVIGEALNSKSKADKHWAVEQMGKLYSKAVPQKIGGDKDNPVEVLVKFINGNENNRNSS